MLKKKKIPQPLTQVNCRCPEMMLQGELLLKHIPPGQKNMTSDQTHQTAAVRKTYQIVPGPEMGLVSPTILARIAEVALKYSIPLLKITAGQRLSFVGLDPADVPAIWHDLGHHEGPRRPQGLQYVQACPGRQLCKYGRQDSLHLATLLQEALAPLTLPAKTKIGISGCAMNCCESFVRDLGIFGKKNGWTLVFGGNGGGRPRLGDIIATTLSDQQVVTLARECLHHYARLARPKERTARFMERTSLEDFKKTLRTL
jgi:NAD(P)H-nitrite reductase large subunit